MRLSHPSQLPVAVSLAQKALAVATKRAMVRTARYGHTAVARMTARTRPQPMATNTYRNSWTVVKTKHGAILGNSSLQSYFVEVGRKPGKMPPFTNPAVGVLPWVHVKRLGLPQKKKRKPSQKKKKQQPTSLAGILAGGPQTSKPKKPKKAKVPKMPPPPSLQQKRLAYLIARKVALKGTPGRYVLARTMPAIKKRLGTEIQKSLKVVKPGTP
jgi:hypothetical protein